MQLSNVLFKIFLEKSYGNIIKKKKIKFLRIYLYLPTKKKQTEDVFLKIIVSQKLTSSSFIVRRYFSGTASWWRKKIKLVLFRMELELMITYCCERINCYKELKICFNLEKIFYFIIWVETIYIFLSYCLEFSHGIKIGVSCYLPYLFNSNVSVIFSRLSHSILQILDYKCCMLL